LSLGKDQSASKQDRRKLSTFLKKFVEKIVWFLFVPLIGLLGYYTTIRPYIFTNNGAYVAGFVDGTLVTIVAIIIVTWVISDNERALATVSK
jgi:hypothetical protein